ncbi:MAG: hypothetical protein ACE5GO_09035, partial [Anaerolineales bacterium]
MATHRSWQAYQPTYRAGQMKTLAPWILAGVSGTVVGMGGSGKWNLLGFLCHRPEVLQSYLAPLSPDPTPVVLIPVDLNNLPSNTLATLYRIILRSFYETRAQFEPEVQQTITALYLENRSSRDPFLSQSALRELLLAFQARGTRVVLVLDRFDRFCQTATPQMTDTLRGLRDSFKDTLSYIIGMNQEVVYLTDPGVLGEMYELLDTHVCWVGAMNEADARQMIVEETHLVAPPPNEAEIVHLLALTGGYPSLLKAACHWWLETAPKPAFSHWLDAQLAQRSVQFRLDEIWKGLTQEERLALSEVQKLQGRGQETQKAPERAFESLGKQHRDALQRQEAKRLCEQVGGGWRVFSDLFAAYIASVEGRGCGKLWRDERTDALYQGQTHVEGLAPLERAVLCFLVTHPRVRHTKTDLIVNT